MKTIVLLCCLPLLLLTGCKQVVMWRYGIHKPRVETAGRIERFLQKRDYPATNVMLFSDSSTWSAFLKDPVFQPSLLSTLFYSREGLLDQFRDTTQCQWSGGAQARRLKRDTLYHTDTSYTIGSLLAMVNPLIPGSPPDTAGADFYAVVTWGSFLGTYNDRLFGIREVVASDSSVKIIPIYVCIDMLQEWNLTKEQVLSFRDD